MANPTTSTSTTHVSATSQNVTLPVIDELFDTNFLDRLLPASQFSKPVSNPGTAKNAMMEALKASSDRTFTLNYSPAFSTTDSASLDAFLRLSRYTIPSETDCTLTSAWAEDPQVTLRNIWYLRSIHDGKSDKEAFYIAYGWLLRNHPRTAIANLSQLVRPVCVLKKDSEPAGAHGYWKDLLNILALATQDALEVPNPQFLHAPRTPWCHTRGVRPKKAATEEERSARMASGAEHTARAQADAKSARQGRLSKAHALLVEKLKQPVYRALYVAVARLFAEQLAADCEVLKKLDQASGTERKVLSRQLSLAGKWAPSGGAGADRVTNITTAIARVLLDPTSTVFPTLPKNVGDPHVQRFFLQRWVFAPLRAALVLPEPLMSTGQWSKVVYPRVASRSMALHASLFAKHDADRFEIYLKDVASGKKSITGATMLPHELVRAALVYTLDPSESKDALTAVKARVASIQAQVVEGQWNALVARLRDSGVLEGAVAVCDVSGSMGHLRASESDLRGRKKGAPEPIFPAVALSLLTARLAPPPFGDGFITFSANPQFVRVDPSLSLGQAVRQMGEAHWGMNTDFLAVFRRLLLPLALTHRVPPDQMIKRLLVFSDMQFDSAQSRSGDWETSHDAVRREYARAGYNMPEIVYWDLASTGQYQGGPGRTVPVKADREGVSMLSGFSSGMMKVFLGEEEPEELDAEMKEAGWEEVGKGGQEQETRERKARNPLDTMKQALGVASFDGLVVVD